MGLLNHAYTSNSHNFIPTKKNQVKIHPTIPKATYNAKLYKPSTLSKLHNTNQLNNSKMPQNKKSTWPHNSFQPKHTMSKIPTRANNNKMTMPHHKVLNKIWNQQIYQQKAKKKNELTLKSFLDECGAWLLGSWRSPSSSFHSRDGWYFFPLKVRKWDGPWGDAMEMQRWRFENEFQKNGFCKDAKKLKDLKKNVKGW